MTLLFNQKKDSIAKRGQLISSRSKCLKNLREILGLGLGLVERLQ